MAVSPMPSSKRKVSAVVSSEKLKKLKKRRLELGDSSSAQDSAPPPPTSPRKRNSAPGVRVKGSRIYDDKNGKTCHQCRQKTMDFYASCKGTRKEKPCPICFCYKCLLNRYGEKAEEVAVLDNWVCPKCREVCNCSFCMKKRGEKPTGILVHTAKAVGFSSVLELLHHKGPLVTCGDSAGKETEAVAGDSLFPKLGRNSNDLVDGVSKGNAPSSKKKSVKGQPKDAKMKANASPSKKPVTKKKSKRKIDMPEHDNHMMAEIQEQNLSCTADDNTNSETVLLTKSAKKETKSMSGKCHNGSGIGNKKKNAGTVAKNSVEAHDVLVQDKDVHAVKNENKTTGVTDENVKQNKKFRKSRKDLQGTSSDNKENLELNQFSSELGERSTQAASKSTYLQTPLPEGTLLAVVAGIDLPLDAVGGALQFLEFCAAFGKVLGLNKGQAEAVLRELSRTSSRRQGLQSAVVQFHVKLLSLIDQDSDDKHFASIYDSGMTWLQALGKHVTEFPALQKDFPSGIFDKGNAGYNNLDISQKLRLMNFLCDEILTTGDLRDWIENENVKYKRKKKEDREERLLAKEKERDLKQKLKDEVAQAMLSIRTGAPLTVSEHENILSEIKRKTEEVHFELKSSMKLPTKKQKIDAVRTEPFMSHEEGQVFWRLKCYSGGTSILLQEINSVDSFSSKDKWFIYAEEQQKVVEKHILHKRLTEWPFPASKSLSLSSLDLLLYSYWIRNDDRCLQN